MEKDAPAYRTIDEYIAVAPSEAKPALAELRALIRSAAPEATEKISYGIPTFWLNGNLVHFAGYKKHIGFYPGAAGIEAFAAELSAYKLSKGTVQFPIGEPIPLDLVRRIVEYRVAQAVAKPNPKPAKVDSPTTRPT